MNLILCVVFETLSKPGGAARAAEGTEKGSPGGEAGGEAGPQTGAGSLEAEEPHSEGGLVGNVRACCGA